MTKEEIIATDCINDCHKWSNIELRAIHRFMDVFAKQQAIEFDKWKRENGYTIDEHGDYIKLVVDGEFARTEWRPAGEVYNQFIES